MTQVLRPIFVVNFFLFAPCCNYVITDESCLSIVGNDSSYSSVSENTVLRERGDAYTIESSYVPTLDSESSDNKSITWSDFVVSGNKDGSIKYERISSKGSTAEGLVGVSESKIPVELEYVKTWQSSSEPWDCDFYRYQRAFTGTWDASMEWCLWYIRNMG